MPIEAVPNKRQPGDSPRKTKQNNSPVEIVITDSLSGQKLCIYFLIEESLLWPRQKNQYGAII